ncbi:MAG: hydrogenase maturation nickel metallochaperone HypA [Nanoarchaeota archaeon]|nr:hydrogenase maturation nickel metallochaperone HypA [Nanoarchaeota archaeon]
MAELQVKITKYKCDRCGHEWIPREKATPTICPKCKSPYWNKPRRKIKKKNVIPARNKKNL